MKAAIPTVMAIRMPQINKDYHLFYPLGWNNTTIFQSFSIKYDIYIYIYIGHDLCTSTIHS
jgi:hypothetical protein